MADSEATVAAEEQAEQAVAQIADGGEVAPEDTQQADASAENAEQQENGESAAAVNGEDATAANDEAIADEGDEGEGAATTDEQAAAEEPAATENAEPEVQQESEPQQGAEPEVSTEPDTEQAEEQQEADQEESKEEEPTVELPEEEKAKCRNLFDRKAVDGRVDLKGFKILFRLLGQVLSAEDADAMFKEVNSAENGGTIDFGDFCTLYSKFYVGEQTRKEELMNSINKLFPNTDGELVRLKRVEGILMKFQQPDLNNMRLVREKSTLDTSDIKSLVRSMDKRGDGCISKEELVEVLTRHLDMM